MKFRLAVIRIGDRVPLDLGFWPRPGEIEAKNISRGKIVGLRELSYIRTLL